MVNELLIFIGVGGLLLVTGIINLVEYIKENKKLNALKPNSSKLSLNQIKIHKSTLKSNFIQTASVIFTALLILWTVYYGGISLKTNISLANENINFLKQISSTNWANVEIDFGRPEEERITINAGTLSKPTNNLEERYPLGFVMTNSGKINTGYVRVKTQSDKFLHTYLEPNNQINISPQSGVEGVIRIIQRNCAIGAEENCDSNLLPRGNYDLNLTLECQFCQPDRRIIEIVVPLCIYHNNEEWKECNR